MFKSLKPLTKKQTEALIFIVNYIRRNGYSPTYKNIASGAGLKSVGAAAGIILALERKGYIIKEKNKHHSIRLTKALEKIPPRQIRRKTVI